jgi:peptidoglycan/LPS O-acetylase OafA/YrhL
MSKPGWLGLELLDNRYPCLHGMRVVAIISVVQYHVTTILTLEERLPLDRSWATTSMSIFFGMDLFFVLSGFLIGSILLHSIETSGTTQLRRFYLRRVFRTFPSYYVVLTGLVLYALVQGTLTALHRENLPFEYAYLTNYRRIGRDTLMMLWAWSLALEEQFYLAVPFLFFMLQRVRRDALRLGLLGTFWASALVIRLTIFLRGHDWRYADLYDAVYFKTHTRFDTLVAGIVLAYVQRRYGASIARWLQNPGARAALAMPSLACLWILMQPWIFGEEHMLLVRVFSWGTITSVMYFGWTLLLLNDSGGWVQRALSLSVFRRFATLGYGVYLVHIPVCDALVRPLARTLTRTQGWPISAVWFLAVGLLIGASLAVSYLLHVLVEKPSLRIRERLAA